MVDAATPERPYGYLPHHRGARRVAKPGFEGARMNTFEKTHIRMLKFIHCQVVYLATPERPYGVLAHHGGARRVARPGFEGARMNTFEDAKD